MSRSKSAGHTALAFAMLLALTLVGCSGDQSAAPSQPTAPSTAATEAPAGSGEGETSSDAGEAKLDEPVTSGGWTISATDVRGEPMYNGSYAAEGNEYLVVYVEAENSGSAPAKLANGDFTLTDSSGKTYQPRTLGVEQALDGMQPVAAGGSGGPWMLMFEVPKDSAGLKLTFDPSGGTGAKVIAVR